MKCLEMRAFAHTFKYMPGELFDGRPDVVAEYVEETPGEKSVRAARVRVACHSWNVALRTENCRVVVSCIVISITNDMSY